MTLGELLEVTERYQTIAVFKTCDDGFCYQGLAHETPQDLRGLNVESMIAYEWEINVLVKQ